MNLMETLLQNEYTKCNESIPYKTFDHYTELFCQRNCLWDQIKSECSCRPVYVAEKHFPNYTGKYWLIKNHILPLVYINVSWTRMCPSNRVNSSKVCDYLTHVSCVAPIIRTYHNHRCNCLPACDSRQFSIDRIQYGEMKKFRFQRLEIF